MTDSLFDSRKPLIGVIHVGALAWTPRARVERLADALRRLREAGASERRGA